MSRDGGTAGRSGEPPIYLGLMSGTSLDGVDVAAVELGGGGERPRPARLLRFVTDPYEEAFRRRLADVLEAGGPAEICELNFELGRRFAGAALAALEEWGLPGRRIRCLGSHGQTVWHHPPAGDRAGATLQLGEPAVLAEELGLPVIADFRVRDVAAGGHGAPLSPCFDDLLLRGERPRAIQNLGGMGNVTLLPPEGSDRPPRAYDTGPGTALLDAAVERLTGGRLSYDRDGELASRGRPIPGLLEAWLDDPFFRQDPPRSTGRERFGRARVHEWLGRHEGEAGEDLLATLTELTARTVAHGLEGSRHEPEELYLCGGGARNPELRRRIAAVVSPVPVRPLEALGWSGDAREAAAFALLARQHVEGIPVDVSWATGAPGPRILGKRVPA